MWQKQGAGFALGPTESFTAGGSVATVSAFWSDEDGVCVDVSAEMIPAALAGLVAGKIAEYAALTPPNG